MIESSLKGKRILFIGPVFYNYHELIKGKFIEFGADVTFFPERKYGLLFKFFNSVSQKVLSWYQALFYKKILKCIDPLDYDYLYVIRGFMMPEEFLQTLKKNSSLKMIMYQWDANKTNRFFHLTNYFDKVFSFDIDDCKTNQDLEYLPLFYTEDVLNARNNSNNYEYDFLLVGSYLPERYRFVENLIELAKQNNLNGKVFIYMAKSTYYKVRLKGIKLNKAIINFVPMNRNEYLDLLRKSKVVVDLSNKNQTGLAMRLIEAIGADKKILTNNIRIKDEAAYSDSRVTFFDENNLSINLDFFKLNADIALDKKNNEEYSLNNWLFKQFK